MSAINTLTGRTTGRARAVRPAGSTTADEDQRGQGVFGFPFLGLGGGGQRPNIFDVNRQGRGARPVQASMIAPAVDPALETRLSGLGLTPEQTQSFLSLDPAFREPVLLGLEAAAETQGAFESATAPFLEQLQQPAISPETEERLANRAVDTILGTQRAAGQQFAEDLAGRGIADSGLSLAGIQAGQQAAGRDIAGARRDIAIETALANAERQQAAAQIATNILGLQLDIETPQDVLFQGAVTDFEQKQLAELGEEEDDRRRQDRRFNLFSQGAFAIAGPLAMKNPKAGLIFSVLAPLIGEALFNPREGS